MAATFKAKVSLRDITKFRKKIDTLSKKPLRPGEAGKMGRDVLGKMKSLIKRGTSPVRGGGFGLRFPPYKDTSKYPGTRKAHKPVNLRLTGKFLRNLKLRPIKNGIEIGYSDSKQADKEQGHREGQNEQPKRPTIPIAKKRENFAPSIVKLILKHLNAAIRRRAKKR